MSLFTQALVRNNNSILGTNPDELRICRQLQQARERTTPAIVKLSQQIIQQQNDGPPIQTPFSSLKELDSPEALNPNHSAVFLHSNEGNRNSARKAVAQFVKNRALADRITEVFIGVSCFESFSLACIAQSDAILTFDNCQAVADVHELAQQCILQAQTPKEFLELFFNAISKKPELQKLINKCAVNSKSRMDQELQDQTGWLGSQERFQYIKTMVQAERVVHIRMDADSPNSRYENIGKWLQENEAVCTVFYISNVLEWIKMRDKTRATQAWMARIQPIINPYRTIVIDSDNIAARKGRMNQRVYLGKDYLREQRQNALNPVEV